MVCPTDRHTNTLPRLWPRPIGSPRSNAAQWVTFCDPRPRRFINGLTYLLTLALVRRGKLALGGLAGCEDVVHQGAELSLRDVQTVSHPLLVEAKSAQRVHRPAQVDRLLAPALGGLTGAVVVVSGVVEASQGGVEPGPAPIDARLQLQSVVEPLAQRVASSR